MTPTLALFAALLAPASPPPAGCSVSLTFAGGTLVLAEYRPAGKCDCGCPNCSAACPAPAKAAPGPYAEALALVEAGRAVTLYVGTPVQEYSSAAAAVIFVESLPATEPGVYDCSLVGGKPKMARRVPVSAFAPAAPATCVGGSCGTQGFAPSPAPGFAPQFFLPAGGCASGRCPTR
jgi:hypothetical protein